MAQRQKTRQPKVAEEEPSESPSEDSLSETSDEDALARANGDEEAPAEDEANVGDSGDEGEDAETSLAAREETEETPAATQLGAARYVLAGFFAVGMLAAYVFGRAVETIWQHAANKDWFSQALPRLAAVPDEDKATYGLLIGAVIAFVVVLRTYRNPEVRTWADDVASELAKVKWPSRKDVTNSTMVVIAASTVATLYLALLDRLWSFVTSIVYGDGS